MRKFLHRIFDQLLTFKQKPDSPRSAILTAERKALIITQLHSLMEERQPFLIESYSLKNLADELQIRQHQLSVLLNRELGMNFNNYLNQHRVKYCETLIQEGEIRKLNLKGLASKCGFHNRNTFTSAFKRFTGYTPTDYTKRFYYNNTVTN